MPVEDKSTNTERRPKNFASRHVFCGLRIKDIVHIVSQALVPILLAVFTIIITFDQRNESRIQRSEDHRLANEQRLQDLNISRQQRLEDRLLAQEQREQDLNSSREQRENDRWIAEQQRQHDKQIAIDKRLADDINADIQRNMTRDQRLYEVDLEQERYKKEHEKYLDNLLLSYYNEMGEIFQKHNATSLRSYPTSFSLARAKTLNVIQQIGSSRSKHLVMFLYDAGQLTMQEKSLDLSQAHLHYLDLTKQRTLIDMYLVGAYLDYASFDGQDLSYGDFRNALLRNATFKGSLCIGTLFDGADLTGADFTNADLTNASFINTNLQQAVLHRAHGQDPYFQFASMQNADLSNVEFNFSLRLNRGGFIDCNLARSNFRRADIRMSRLIFCNLTHADFTEAKLQGANITGSTMAYAIFTNTDMGMALVSAVNFSYTNLTTVKCSGYGSYIILCSLSGALPLDHVYLPNKSFVLGQLPFFTDKDLPDCAGNVLR